MKKILITGATGFIGNYVIGQLIKKSYSVVATSANNDKAQSAAWYSKVKYIPFNLTAFNTQANYYDFFEQPDIMIHLAWEGLPNYKEPFHLTENLPRHYAFLKNLIDRGLRDLTVTGTCFEYGMQEGCLREDMEVYPANAYAQAKNSLREKMVELQENNEFSLKWIRLFYMYGKGQSPNSLFSQLDKAIEKQDPVFNMSGGKQKRDYLPVEKVADYIVRIATQQKITGIINCCSGNPVTIEEMVNNYLTFKHKQISLNLGYHPYSDYEPMEFWGDINKLKSII